MLREMSTRYGRQPGGYIWAFLEPLGVVVIMAVGFSLLLRSPSLGNNFILFYATGYMPFQMYQATQLAVTRAITFSKPLLSYPAVTWIDTIIARFVLNALTTALVSYILLTGILFATDARAVIDAPPILMAMSLAALTGLGVGALNCLIMGFFPAYDAVWSILTRPLFLASLIFYIYEDLPPLAQDVLWWNPLAHTSGMMRSGFYPMYEPQYVSVLYVLVFALIPLSLGLLLLRRYNTDILLR
jgi:capsular polysaccharide transport system permease protein